MMFLKDLVKKNSLISIPSKLLYDRLNERKLMARVRAFLQQDRLPYTDNPPELYSVGHEPTMRCNLRCKMCYQGPSRNERKTELSADELTQLNQRLRDKITAIKLVGGEPFMRTDIMDIISFWDRNNKKIFLQTNCTLINKKNIATLQRFGNTAGILTSLDGPRELHDTIRGITGTFDRLQETLSLLRTHMPGVPVSIFAVLLFSDNLERFTELIDTCKALGVNTLNVLFEQVYTPEDKRRAHAVFQKTLGWQHDSYRLNTQIRKPLFPDAPAAPLLRKRLDTIRFYGMRTGCFVNFTPFNFFDNIDKYIGTSPGRVFCLKLLAPELRINQTGDVIWCDVIERSFGNLLQQHPDEIWLSDDFQLFRNHLFQHSLPICQRCCKAVYI